MNVSRLLAYTFSACALASPSAAQEESAASAGEREARRVVEVENRGVIGELAMLARELGVGAYASRELGVITLLGPDDAVAIAENAIRRYDVPQASRPEPSPRNADFTAYLILAGLEGQAAPVPDVLESVVAQLRGVLPYEHYGLLETVTLRVADEGLGKVKGVLPPISPALPKKTLYDVALSDIRLPGEGPSAPPAGWVSLRAFLSLGLSFGEGNSERIVQSLIDAPIEIREGQKVVVGKVAVDGAGTSLILVLTMKLDG